MRSLLRQIPSLRIAIPIFAFAFLAQPAWSASLIFFLRNGDRITGEVVSEKSDSVVVRSVGGKLRIPRSEIERREDPSKPTKPTPTSPPGAPALASGALPVGAPAAAAPGAGPKGSGAPPASKPGGEVQPLVSATPPSPALPWYHPAWVAPILTNWNVNLQIGSDLGFGTTDRQTFYGNASAIHRWDRVRNSATFAAAYGVLNGFESANRMDGSIKTDVDLGTKRRIYAFNLAGAGYDEIRRLDLHYQEGAGLGYKLIQRPKLIINTELGAQFQEFDFKGSNQDRNLVSVRFGEDLTWEISPKLKIRQTLAFMPNILDFNDFRAQYTINFAYPLLKRTTLNLNVIDFYDSRPVNGVNNNDLTIQSTIGVSF
jgi:hypothetical protein